MNIRYLAACLGINGETRKHVIRNAALFHGANYRLHWDGPTAGEVYKAVFGEKL